MASRVGQSGSCPIRIVRRSEGFHICELTNLELLPGRHELRIQVNDALYATAFGVVNDMDVLVAEVQYPLNLQGFDAGAADGIQGTKTRGAIVAFQNNQGLSRNGEIDAELLSLLRANR